jgi:hypothetical protein
MVNLFHQNDFQQCVLSRRHDGRCVHMCTCASSLDCIVSCHTFNSIPLLCRRSSTRIIHPKKKKIICFFLTILSFTFWQRHRWRPRFPIFPAWTGNRRVVVVVATLTMIKKRMLLSFLAPCCRLRRETRKRTEREIMSPDASFCGPYEKVKEPLVLFSLLAIHPQP